MIIKEAIALAAKYISKHPSHPILACVNSDGKTLQAFDLETAIEIKLSTLTPIFCVNGEALRKVTAKLDKFTIATTEDAIQITGKGSNQIATIDPAEFPLLPEVKGDRFTVWESKLFKAWSTVKSAINPNHHSRMYQGASLKIRDNVATIAATDGHKAAQTTFKVMAPDCSLIIPFKFFEILKAKSDRELEIYHDDFNICMAIADITITSRLIEGNYPEMPSASNNFAVLDREYRAALLDNLAIAKAMGSKTIDLYVRGQKLILKTFTIGGIKESFSVDVPTPTHLYYFAMAIASPVISYASYSGGRPAKPKDKYKGIPAQIYFTLDYEFIETTLSFTLPIAANCDQQARINIDNLVKVINTTDKDRDLTINIAEMIEVGSLGKNNASILMASKEAPELFGEVIDIRTRQAIAA